MGYEWTLNQEVVSRYSYTRPIDIFKIPLRIKTTFLLLLFLLSLPFHCYSLDLNHWLEKADEIELHEEDYWRKLLHLQSIGGFWYYTDVITPDFYLTHDPTPKKEIVASIKAIFNTMGMDQDPREHFQCRFIARYEWIQSKLNIPESELPKIDCSEFEDWAALHNIKTIEILFSGAQLGNPATLFGHPLLRIKRSYQNENPFLSALDESVSFAAEIDNRNNFVWKGVTGGYRAAYQQTEFQNYRNMYGELESRDLYAYELNTTKADIRRLMTHLWELNHNVYFSYYFFKANCSYRLGELLEITFPEKSFLYPVSVVYPPITIIHQLKEQKNGTLPLVKQINYHTSVGTRLQKRLESLSEKEVQLIYKHGKEENFSPPAEWGRWSTEKKVYWMDTLLEYLQYQTVMNKRARRKKDWKKKTFGKWRRFLKVRATLPAGTPLPEIKMPADPPHTDPKTTYFKLKHSPERGNGIQTSIYEHDFISGYGSNFFTNLKIKFFSFDLYYDEPTDRFQLNEFGIIEYNQIPDFPEFSVYKLPVFLNGNLRYRQQNEFCEACNGWQGEIGLTWNLHSQEELGIRVYSLLDFFVQERDQAFAKNKGAFVGLGAMIFPFKRFGVRVESRKYYLTQYKESEFEEHQIKLAYQISPSWELSAEFFQQSSSYSQAGFSYRW